MNYARIVAAAAASTVAYYALGFLIFGLITPFSAAYRPYTAVYRPSEAIFRYMPFGFGGTFVATLILGVIFAKFCQGTPGPAAGARFGVLVGLFAVCAFVGDNFVTLNIGRRLAAFQAVAAILEWTTVGTVIGLIYKPKAATP
ncbi:MAG TPA: hypothetical protein VEZ11_16870 [Thermoanaerobaculia bacterium]|nr:hypothetical protein [Thermoanaerobaculia bacterium]